MVVVVGPYVGGIESELFVFQPYVNWLHLALRGRYESFYVFSHEQHRFLYDLEGIKFIPVSAELSSDKNHSGLTNILVSNKEYLSLLKSTKNSIRNSEVLQCFIKYTKYDNFVLPLYKKLFKRIKVDVELEPELVGKVILINRGADLNVSKKILSQVDAIEINGRYPFSIDKTLKLVQKAKLVICPAGVWTVFCNLHNIPVISWGDQGLGLYKENGPYAFNNKNIYILHYSGGDIKAILSGIQDMMERLK